MQIDERRAGLVLSAMESCWDLGSYDDEDNELCREVLDAFPAFADRYGYLLGPERPNP